MKKTMLCIFLLILAFGNAQFTYAMEKDKLSERKDVLLFLEEAFHAQVHLSEKHRELSEVNALLTPYFSDDYINKFLKANLVKENGKYIIYGSDFAPYYIPYFQFSENTEIDIHSQKIYVYEYFESPDDGPLYYEDHYEGMLLEKINGQWKVSKQLSDEEITKYLSKNAKNENSEVEKVSRLNKLADLQVFAQLKVIFSLPFAQNGR
ncbi:MULTISPECIES: DUF3993 domain-containing protein [unclassified Niallia]|uniref:DUF3993 domain-containing protein n=1 Tax=unclassified Niallia TaxID=2837522 RepID=UPI001EDADA3A|nr:MULTISPECIES: DUF3993 domain-containing protein [unclassified Niallia]MCM3029143.1 DUF3993 domain-containing protein [Niallia sp. MER 6]MDL0434970.1 DUF3993 domain-containing protein [Niallia sp. SS-2023]UPO88777.1 DUF3993 domain-containing protein [Niallia sp. Man26]